MFLSYSITVQTKFGVHPNHWRNSTSERISLWSVPGGVSASESLRNHPLRRKDREIGAGRSSRAGITKSYWAEPCLLSINAFPVFEIRPPRSLCSGWASTTKNVFVMVKTRQANLPTLPSEKDRKSKGERTSSYTVQSREKERAKKRS